MHFVFFFWQLTRFSELTGFGWIAIIGLLVILHSPFSSFCFSFSYLIASVVQSYVSSLLMKEHTKSAKSYSSNFVVCVPVRALV